MPAFAELDWRRIDVTAIVTAGGIATIDEPRRDACRAWLGRHGYATDTLDCAGGLAGFVPAFSQLLRWPEQFGYELSIDRCNLNAVRDGFDFAATPDRGRVLELLHADRLWGDDKRWADGLLSIACGHTRTHLALGTRFFTLLVMPADSRLIGREFDRLQIPPTFWDPAPAVRAFDS
jgi:hypothetical protein